MDQKIIDDADRRRRADQRAAEQREIELTEDVDVLVRKIRSLPAKAQARLKAELDAILETNGREEGGPEEPRSPAV